MPTVVGEVGRGTLMRPRGGHTTIDECLYDIGIGPGRPGFRPSWPGRQFGDVTDRFNTVGGACEGGGKQVGAEIGRHVRQLFTNVNPHTTVASAQFVIG